MNVGFACAGTVHQNEVVGVFGELSGAEDWPAAIRSHETLDSNVRMICSPGPVAPAAPIPLGGNPPEKWLC